MATPTTKEYVDAQIATLASGGDIDTFWLIMCGVFVFFMQCGFAMLEAGTVRSKNTKNILLKNMLDACLGAIIWWCIGHGFAYDGGNAFIGTGDSSSNAFFLQGFTIDEVETGYEWATWFFQFVFAAAAATIVSGAMAERTQLTGYLMYTTMITGIIYPVVVHWVWSSKGWASAFNAVASDAFKGGTMDFAGSGVVHMTGGVAALWGAAIIGPRKGRFDESRKALPMPGHSTTLQVLGTFILWVGWYGFNPGSTLGLSAANYARDAARSVVTTTLSAAAGGLTVVILEKLAGDHTWSVSAVCNGILAGLVSITAGCSTIMPVVAFCVGIIGGFVYFGVSKLVLNVCHIDDPLDAFAVHGACGFWGVLAVGFFAADRYTYNLNGKAGAFYGDGDALLAAFCTLLAEVAWVSGTSVLMFLPMKMMGILRVSAEVEEAGMDVSKHGGSAYESGK